MNGRLNGQLSCKFTKVEIHTTIFEIGGSKALGSDGFLGSFFQNFWDIMWLEILLDVQEFQLSKVMPNDVNSTFIALIPKVT